MIDSAELALHSVDVAGVRTAYVDRGSGPAVLMIHGSGPGASAISTWRGNFPALHAHRAVALDLAGFGSSVPLGEVPYTVPAWARQCFALLDALGIERTSVIGNSLGGRIAMEMALMLPARIEKLVLMGSGGLLVEPTPALRALRAYTPSFENMQRLIADCFLYDPSLASEALVRERYEASVKTFDVYHGMFSADRSGMVLTPERIATIAAPSLVVHGRDDRVIPPDNGVQIARLLQDADLHVFARCGHWAQFERGADFNPLVAEFLR
jgi:2-hydroxymuconate-semialdehyde hydrolase